MRTSGESFHRSGKLGNRHGYRDSVDLDLRIL
jgi:hypothetical protein